MGRSTNKLSVQGVKKSLPPGLYGDGGGLYLQVSQQRTKAWVFRFMMAGRARKMGLGRFDLISLAEARKKAGAAYALVVDGIDPIDDRDARKTALAVEKAKTLTFKECAERYISAHKSGWKSDKHAGQWAATLERYAYPKIGSLPVAAIDVGLILEVLEPIWTDKTETASRVRGRIERAGWSIAHEDDYNADPKATGYRSVHLVVVRDATPVEIQLRTTWQQEWAAAVERLDLRYGLALKDGLGPDPLAEFMERLAYARDLQGRGVALGPGLPDELTRLAVEAERWLSNRRSTR